MKVVLQVVSSASVEIEAKVFSKIEEGLLVLVGIEASDSTEDVEWLSGKITNMRLFTDENGMMNESVKDVKGDVLVVSQFTLQASTKKGNRPSYMRAAKPEIAIPVYQQFVTRLALDLGKSIATGVFGADMKVALVNKGPVTIVIDSKIKD
jgi:D-tyrosyl-tRNA(Tyr) deacylase